MSYPPKPHHLTDRKDIGKIARAYPFAHLFTGDQNAQHVTRLPFVYDAEKGAHGRLRSHLNRANPQASDMDGVSCLVAFSGPDAYVSPNWRTSTAQAATWDYTAVHMWGRIRVRPERAFFAQLINDLAAPQEAAHASLTEAEPWRFEVAPEDYVNHLFPHLVAFEIEVERIEAIAKLHQDFPVADQESVARHLAKIESDDHQALATLMRESTEKRRGR